MKLLIEMYYVVMKLMISCNKINMVQHLGLLKDEALS